MNPTDTSRSSIRKRYVLAAAMMGTLLITGNWLASRHAMADTVCKSGVGGGKSDIFPHCVGEHDLDQLWPVTVWPKFGACFQIHSKCELQPNSKCGWTPSPELDACISDPTKLKEAEHALGVKSHGAASHPSH